MRLLVSLEPIGKKLNLPIHYNRFVQASIYSLLDPAPGALLHDHGFRVGERVFRGFTFSRLLGRFVIDATARTIAFTGPIRLVIASPLDEFCNMVATRLLGEGVMRLGRTGVRVAEVIAENSRISSETVEVLTLSPVVAYSTLLKADGRQYTCYFQPGEPEFQELVSANLRKKGQALAGMPADAQPRAVCVQPLAQPRLSVIQYKGTVIKGYSGPLRLEGPVSLLQLALDAGLGSKNSQGFGCLETIERGRKEGLNANREPHKAGTTPSGRGTQRRRVDQADH